MHEAEPSPASQRWRRLAVVGAALPLLLLWDASGLDLPLARWFGASEGFPLQYDPFLKGWMHEGARQLGWVVLALLITCIWRPMGALKQLTRSERAWMIGTIVLSLLVVVAIKGISRTSCPWDLTEFGGTAQYVSHWAWGVQDGGGGHCFPAGHASTAFAFMALAVWLRAVSTRAGAWAWGDRAADRPVRWAGHNKYVVPIFSATPCGQRGFAGRWPSRCTFSRGGEVVRGLKAPTRHHLPGPERPQCPSGLGQIGLQRLARLACQGLECGVQGLARCQIAINGCLFNG
jgi:membrane-associated PAP2 superfamily phosphatase